MKTQTFGLAPSTAPLGYPVGDGFWTNWWHETNNIAQYGLPALTNYRATRENGDEIDIPTRGFPNDGKYSWEGIDKSGKARYDEGPEDKKWMEEKDRNYVLRLEREGRLDQVEPNLRNEVPKLYDEIIAARRPSKFSKFEQDLKSNVVVVDLTLNGEALTLERVRILSEFIAQSKSLKSLDLSGVPLTPEMGTILLPAFIKCRTLLDLNITGTDLNYSLPQIKRFVRIKQGHEIVKGVEEKEAPPLVIPNELKCPVTRLIMLEPVMTCDGETYEREAIAEWLENHNTSPTTNIGLEDKRLMPNKMAKRSIDTFLSTHPELWEGDEIYVATSVKKKMLQAVHEKDRSEIDRLLALDKRLLIRPLLLQQHLLLLACSSTPEILQFVIQRLGDKFWTLPEIEADEGVIFFRIAAITLGAPGARIIADVLGWRNNPEIQEQFNAAIDAGNSVLAAVCLELGANFKDCFPLHRALTTGHVATAKFSLECKADANLADTTGNYPLHHAVLQGSRCVNFLLGFHEPRLCCAAIEERQFYFETGSEQDSFFGPTRVEAVKLLQENFANPQVRDLVSAEIKEAMQHQSLPSAVTQSQDYQRFYSECQSKRTALQTAQPQSSATTKVAPEVLSASKALEQAESNLFGHLMREDVYRQFVQSEGRGLMALAHLRAKAGIKEAANVCIWQIEAVSSVVSQTSSSSSSGSSSAAKVAKPIENIKVVISSGNIYTATHILRNGNRFAVLEMTALPKAFQPLALNLNVKDAKGITPLQLALDNFVKESDYFVSVRLLVNAGADLEIPNAQGDTILLQAIRLQNSELFDLLLARRQNPANLEVRDRTNNTALHLALGLKQYNFAKILIEKGVQLEARETATATGDTILLRLLRNNQQELLKLAFARNPSCGLLEMKDAEGNALLHLAFKLSCFEIIPIIIQELTKVKANLEMPNPAGDTPLLSAARANRLDLVELLFKNGACVDTLDKYGNNALHIAAQNGHRELAMFLLAHGINGKAENKQAQVGRVIGKRPSDVAKDAGYGDLAREIEFERHKLKLKPFLAPLLHEIQQDKQKIAEQDKRITELLAQLGTFNPKQKIAVVASAPELAEVAVTDPNAATSMSVI